MQDQEFQPYYRLWASKRYEIPLERIDHVEFEMEDGFAWSEWTVEGARICVKIYLNGDAPIKVVEKTEYNMAEIVREVTRTAVEAESQLAHDRALHGGSYVTNFGRRIDPADINKMGS